MSKIVKLKKGENVSLTENFSSSEMDCKCTNASCKTTLIDLKHMEILQAMRNVFGPLKITSGFRCKEHNKAVGGSKNSQHLLGVATDIKVTTKLPQEAFAMLADNLFNAVGRYSTFTHVDSREGKKASWDFRK